MSAIALVAIGKLYINRWGRKVVCVIACGKGPVDTVFMLKRFENLRAEERKITVLPYFTEVRVSAWKTMRHSGTQVMGFIYIPVAEEAAPNDPAQSSMPQAC